MGEYDHVTYDGQAMTRRQRVAIRDVESHADVSFVIVKGSWKPVDDISGTTHHGAGVIDIWLPSMSDNERTHEVTRKLRRIGCQAAFLRGPGKFGGYGWHWHVVDLDTRGMDTNAVWQVSEYRAGNDGLVAGRDDPVKFRPDPIRPYDFDAYQDLRTRLNSISERIELFTRQITSLRRRRRAAKVRREQIKERH